VVHHNDVLCALAERASQLRQLAFQLARRHALIVISFDNGVKRKGRATSEHIKVGQVVMQPMDAEAVAAFLARPLRAGERRTSQGH
jgi:hypothetical protein